MKYEVYKCTISGIVVYVGHGLIGRHKHCSSGHSHNKGLNYFVKKYGKDIIQITIVKIFKYKDNASFYEKELIGKLKPVFNVIDNKFRPVEMYYDNKYQYYHKLHLKDDLEVDLSVMEALVVFLYNIGFCFNTIEDTMLGRYDKVEILEMLIKYEKDGSRYHKLDDFCTRSFIRDYGWFVVNLANSSSSGIRARIMSEVIVQDGYVK